MSKLSKPLNEFWDKQIQHNDVVLAKPFSGSCMFCAKELTQQDEDHSVCNVCWSELGEEE
tara:strand:+ start:339 stop:518 length:180 start_codon:yes stop_codon:yes gene_type:complete